MVNGNQRKFIPQTGGGLQLGTTQPPQFFTGGTQGFNELTGRPRISTGLQVNQQQPRISTGLQVNQPQQPPRIARAEAPPPPPPGEEPEIPTEQLFKTDLREGLIASGFDPNVLQDFLTPGGKDGTGGFVGGQAPEFTQFDLQDSAARQQFQDIFGQATGGTIQSFDRAQNRLRERTRQGADIASQQATERALGGGRGAFQGAIQGQLGQIETGRLGALSQGQVGLESQFEDARLRGLQTALGASQGLGGLDTAFNQLGLQQSLAGNQFAQSIFQEAERLRQQAGESERGDITDRVLGLIDQITKQGGIRGGILTSLGGGFLR